MLYLKPDDLRNDKSFQDHYSSVQVKLEAMLQWWQRDQVSKHQDDLEEIGRRVEIISEFFDLLERCSTRSVKGEKTTKKRPKLYNKN